MAKKAKFSTTLGELPFQEDIKTRVFKLGKVVSGKNPDIWRKDIFGALIKFTEYDNKLSEYGWHIDHKIPKVLGSTDDISNLQPLFWYRNRLKSDYYPYTKAIIKRHNPLIAKKIIK